VYYYPYYYYYYLPVGGDGANAANVQAVIRGNPSISGYAPQSSGINGQSYPYDGGPSNPVPWPGPAPQIKPAPQKTVPLEGTPISYPAPSTAGRYVYPAYGEQPARTSFAEDRLIKK
jgi:hypothetical protein